MENLTDRDCVITPAGLVLLREPRLCPQCRGMRCWFRTVAGRTVCWLCAGEPVRELKGMMKRERDAAL